MNEHLDDRIRELARDYHQPDALGTDRRAALWQRISPESAVTKRRSPAPRRRRWGAVLSMGAVAVLLIGIAIGQRIPADPALPTEEAPRWTQDTAEALYQIVARDYLGRTETLLTEFRMAALRPSPESPISPGAGDPARAWAGDLLVETRLLLDSPAAKDVRLQALLEELELVLAEIVQVGDDADRSSIREELDRRALLLRVREGIPAKDGSRGA
jgi:hypothetical protein